MHEPSVAVARGVGRLESRNGIVRPRLPGVLRSGCLVMLGALAALFPSNPAVADGIAYEGFAYPVGTIVLGSTIVADFQFDTVQVGAEGEAIDIDEIRLGTTYADVVGSGGPFSVYRAASPGGLLAPSNVVASVASTPYDDSPSPASLLFYEVDNGMSRPEATSLMKVGTSAHITWP